MNAGHPCYFVGFLPDPVPGQTIEDIMKAEVAFIEKVAELHPDASGKPTIVGNCQAGWAAMMLASYRPDLCGPIIVAGSPLSYWAGVHGKNPMRYTGGLLGGTWLTALTGDLGAGKFDGAWLVSNFEGMNPANTHWSKKYNVYKNVDTESERFLGFEKWWSGHILLNAEEMQWIVDNLFVGNRLPTAEVETTDGVRLDFRNIRSPIICFCSHGDDITPPQQALGWILDLYADVQDIRACGQTIVYAVHPSVGHLGIFVSGGVAKKEHREFASNIDLIDCLPPGLYEAVLTEKTEDTPDADLVATDYIARFETRTLEDIRALGTNSEEDERRFATAARVSDVNKGLYQTFAQPWVKTLITEEQADLMMKIHPARLEYTMFSDKNPVMGVVKSMAKIVRSNRKPVERDNPFLVAQEQMSDMIIRSLDNYRDMRDNAIEALFLSIYANPLLQATVGLSADEKPPRARPGRSPEHIELVKRKVEDLKARISHGGVREACIRAMIYIGQPDSAADERRFEFIRSLRKGVPGELEAFKLTVREQFFMLLIDESAAIAALPDLLKGHADEIEQGIAFVRQVASTGGEPSDAVKERLSEIEKVFNTALCTKR